MPRSNMTSDTCPFCHRSSEIIGNELGYATWDSYPVSPGHCLVVPRRHFASFFDATDAERVALLELVVGARAILEAEHRPDGYNIGVNVGEAAGQSVMHLHIHVIPRYRGDMENPRGGVRGVIPEKQKY